MKKMLLIIALLVLGCTPQQEKISEAEAIKAVEVAYDAVKQYHKTGSFDLVNEYYTDDFMSHFEGRRINKDKFKEVLVSQSAWLLEWDFELSDFRVKSGNDWAHVSFLNTSKLIIKTDSINLDWHGEFFDSVLLIKEDDKLEVSFFAQIDLNSDSEPVELD